MLAPGFPSPPNSDYVGYHAYINDHLPPESPHLYGLHPNAEIGFLTATSEKLFRTVFELQPRESGSGSGPAPNKQPDATQGIGHGTAAASTSGPTRKTGAGERPGDPEPQR